MFNDLLIQLVKKGRLRWQKHALERMLERDIYRSDVISVLENGEIIEEYSEDYPFPSVLILGYKEKTPVHVVVGIDKNNEWCYIITVYKPDKEHFEPNFKTRRQ